MESVQVKGYLSPAEIVSSIMGCGSEEEYFRRLDAKTRENAQPRLVEVLAYSPNKAYAVVPSPWFTDAVKLVNVGTQELVPGNYDETSFYPAELGYAKLQELDPAQT